MRRLLGLLSSLLVGLTALAPHAHAQVRDRYFTSSDGVRLHYLEAGPSAAHTIVFVPGWTMPGWIFSKQIEAFSREYHVVAFDPRGQGDSDIPPDGYEPVRRGLDVAELVAHVGSQPVVIVGWSLGVLDTLASINVSGDRRLAGLVLVDNSVGEEPAPTWHPVPHRRAAPPSREAAMHRFVSSMFHYPQPEAYIDRLTETCLRVPIAASRSLLAYPEPRSYWRDAIYATRVPVLYAIRPLWVAQGENLVRNRPETQMEVFSNAGHALFIDDAPRFDMVMENFLHRWVWR